MFRGIFSALILLFLISQFITAQNPYIPKSDSTRVIRKIEKQAMKAKFTNFVYTLIFKPTTTPPVKKKVTSKPYVVYEGKPIRNINIKILDPFGADINDSVESPHSFVEKTGNKLHKKTLPLTIKNLLLFKQNDLFDSLIVEESERLIRVQNYVYEVLFLPKLVTNKADSVDISIRVQDSWSITGEGDVSPSQFNIGLTDQNFLGTGHSFHAGINWPYRNPYKAYEFNYFIPNIRNTHITTNLQIKTNEDKSFTKGLNIERNFYTPLAKWAGGISIGQQLRKEKIFIPKMDTVLQNFKFNAQDIWVSKAWQILKGKAIYERTTNLILSAGYLHVKYLDKPPLLFDTLHIYSAERFYLLGLGISTRQYIEDKYLFKYDISEEVPVGKAFGLTGGYQFKNNIGRFYIGVSASLGNYYKWGYFSPYTEYGRFIHNSTLEEGVFRMGANYFTGIKNIEKWHFRIFFKPQLTLGIDRLPTDTLLLGIRGFNNTRLYGVHKIMAALQIQSYAPWNVIGFRFGPYLIYSIAMLGSKTTGFRNSSPYSLFGIGVLIRNDFLVQNNFQISIEFYPLIPGAGRNIFKFDTYSTSDFGIRDFNIDKPGTVPYQ